MKKSLQQLVFGSLFAAILVASSAANAQTTTKPKTTETETPKPKRDWYPFYGTVETVDKSAKTVSLKKKEGERVLHTDSQTTLEMGGKPTSIAAIRPGYYLHGKLHKEDGKEEFILDAKIELEAPMKNKGTNHVAATTVPVMAPATATDDSSTNAVVKKKKKKKASADTNAPASSK